MKITIFNGSHQGRRGNTAVMVDAFLHGASEAGATVKHLMLTEYRVEFCRACKACWFQTPGRCPIADDMPELTEAYLGTDIVGFATPLYVDNVSGRMKVFLDRLIQTGDPHWEVDASGECIHRRRFERPTGMVVLANCGYPEQTHFQPLEVIFRRMARNQHLELVGEIYRGGGGLLTKYDPGNKQYIGRYIELVREAGREVATRGHIGAETSRLLRQPLLPDPDFVGMFRRKVNEMCDAMAARTDAGTS